MSLFVILSRLYRGLIWRDMSNNIAGTAFEDPRENWPRYNGTALYFIL